MVMILLASSDWLAASETAELLRKVLTALFGPIPDARFLLIHALVRKTGHAVAYAILSWLAYRSARGPVPAAPAWTWRPALCALGLSLITAVLDEAHQVFTEARTGSALDVLLDMTGALLALALMWMVAKRKPKPAAHA
jgi:VanZ family protein